MPISINNADKVRIHEIIAEGVNVNVEIQTLRDGLSDTVKSVAKELDIKPALINKAIKIAHKNNFDEHQEDLDDIEEILMKAGYRNSPAMPTSTINPASPSNSVTGNDSTADDADDAE